MNNIKLYLLVVVAIILSGCAGTNNPSLSTIQDEKSNQIRESDYKDILIQKDIALNAPKDDIKNKIRLIMQSCIKSNFIITERINYNERFSSNAWFDITDENIIIESNLRDILKVKSDINSETINLGGRYGNRMLKISLPYKITKMSDTVYKLVVHNNETIKSIESVSAETGKPFENNVYNSKINEFKDDINRTARCVRTF